MSDPMVAKLDITGTDFDPWEVEQNLKTGASELRTRVPTVYQDAVVDHPVVREWVTGLVEGAKDSHGPCPAVMRGPSLLLLGPVGTGKTHLAYAAVRALSVSGARCNWEFVSAARIYMRLRPRPKVDTDEEFERLAKVGLLVVDDLGASNSTEWTAEQNFLLVDYRYSWGKPTVVTSNLPVEDRKTPGGVEPGLGSVLGERVVSRLREMSTQVVLKGTDRRRAS